MNIRFATWLLLPMMLFGGCGQVNDNPPRRSVHGTITYAGKPIEHGEIRFIPQPKGPIAIAVIEQGKYQTLPGHEVPVGTARIEIRVIARPASTLESTPELPADVANFPEKYNVNSTLTVEIPPGKDQLQLNFNLEK